MKLAYVETGSVAVTRVEPEVEVKAGVLAAERLVVAMAAQKAAAVMPGVARIQSNHSLQRYQLHLHSHCFHCSTALRIGSSRTRMRNFEVQSETLLNSVGRRYM
jgi:hypothetical protein